MVRMIDLNADLGESTDAADIGRDIAMLQYVSSANIACGGHAGDAETMKAMVNAARSAKVSIGAHPSYPDREGFGRRSIDIETPDLRSSLSQQIEALCRTARLHNTALTHVKPHGALYNDAADDSGLAQLIADLVKEVVPDAALVGLSGGAMAEAAKQAGLRFIAEGFIDRRYDAQGRLVPRSMAGAVIEEEEARIGQALALAKGAAIMAHDGTQIDIAADSLCLHSDSNGALNSAKHIHSALGQAGIAIGQRRIRRHR